jgi:hypothetical protein
MENFRNGNFSAEWQDNQDKKTEQKKTEETEAKNQWFLFSVFSVCSCFSFFCDVSPFGQIVPEMKARLNQLLYVLEPIVTWSGGFPKRRRRIRNLESKKLLGSWYEPPTLRATRWAKWPKHAVFPEDFATVGQLPELARRGVRCEIRLTSALNWHRAISPPWPEGSASRKKVEQGFCKKK